MSTTNTPEIRGLVPRCKTCAHFVETENGRGLCVAHGRPQKAEDLKCSTHYQSISEAETRVPA